VGRVGVAAADDVRAVAVEVGACVGKQLLRLASDAGGERREGITDRVGESVTSGERVGADSNREGVCS
jgi:hypothetical protein